jgi:hypothetical protein
LGLRRVFLGHPLQKRGYGVRAQVPEGSPFRRLVPNQYWDVRVDITRPFCKGASLIRWLSLRGSGCAGHEAECGKPNASTPAHGQKLCLDGSTIKHRRALE